MAGEPGYRLHLSAGQRADLERPTVKLGERYGPAGANPWAELCSGLKVWVPHLRGQYVVTAGHCFRAIIGSKYGVLFQLGVKLGAAENFIGNNFAYTILDPLAPIAVREGRSDRERDGDLDRHLPSSAGRYHAAVHELGPGE